MKYLSIIFLSFICFHSANCQSPAFEWAYTIGNQTFDCSAYANTIDSAGNCYTLGSFNGTVDFDPGPLAFNLDVANGNVFISKLSSSGSHIWAKQFGGPSAVTAIAMTSDTKDNIYITGYFTGTADFDPGPQTLNLTAIGFSNNIFILKIDASGNLVWAKNMGGTSGECLGEAITADANKNLYITGSYTGIVDFDPWIGTTSLSTGGNYNRLFVLKFDQDGHFIWVKDFGGAAMSAGQSICANGLNQIYVTGYFGKAVSYIQDGTAHTLQSNGKEDICLLKYDTLGNIVWAKGIGGPSSDQGYSTATDKKGNIYTTGFFSDTLTLSSGNGNLQAVSKGLTDGFIAKNTAEGNFIWVRTFGDSQQNTANSIAIDGHDNVLISGVFSGSIDFDSGPDDYTLSASSSISNYITKLDAEGTHIWSVVIDGDQSSECEGYKIQTDKAGNIYTTGEFMGSIDFDPGSGTDLRNTTYSSGFTLKLNDRGIRQIEHDGVGIYPNPTQGELVIGVLSPSEEGAIIVYNLLGEVIFYRKGVKERNIIDISHVANGIYLLSVSDKDKLFSSQRIVKY